MTGDPVWWQYVNDGITSISADVLPAFRWLVSNPAPTQPWANAGQCCGGAAGLDYAVSLRAACSAAAQG